MSVGLPGKQKELSLGSLVQLMPRACLLGSLTKLVLCSQCALTGAFSLWKCGPPAW